MQSDDALLESLRTRTTLMSVTEAAKVLDLSKATLHRRIKDGKFPVVRLGPASTKVKPSDLLAYLNARSGTQIQAAHF